MSQLLVNTLPHSLKFRLDFPDGMVSFTHAGYGHEANLLPVDADLHVDYHYHDYEVHYHRFGRGEEQLAR